MEVVSIQTGVYWSANLIATPWPAFCYLYLYPPTSFQFLLWEQLWMHIRWRNDQEEVFSLQLLLNLQLLILHCGSHNIFLWLFIRVPWEPNWEADSESICFSRCSVVSLYLKISGTNKTFKSDRVGSFFPSTLITWNFFFVIFHTFFKCLIFISGFSPSTLFIP